MACGGGVPWLYDRHMCKMDIAKLLAAPGFLLGAAVLVDAATVPEKFRYLQMAVIIAPTFAERLMYRGTRDDWRGEVWLRRMLGPALVSAALVFLVRRRETGINPSPLLGALIVGSAVFLVNWVVALVKL